ncbi:MAG: winged helix-turn-helix domain-containing protein [Acidimicrobiia bacterium]|nr:winged helix-turn-helix domain-containing protein [Acidimicrobiia bacterium]
MAPVEDFTSRRPRLEIEVVHSPAYELLVALWSRKHDDCSEFELGNDWFTELDAGVARDLDAELGALSASLVAVALMGEVGTAPTVGEFLRQIEHTDASRILELVMDLVCSGETELSRAAAKGDSEARTDVLARLDEDERAPVAALFEVPSADLPTRLTAAFGRYHAEVLTGRLDDFGDAAARDALARRGMALALPIEDLIEQATKGVNYRIMPGVSKVRLAPSVLIRPWSMLTQHGDTLVVTYPVDDEFFDGDANAAPTWLVNTYKALGDDRRLRILKILADGQATLSELADQLDVAKSTLHHHIGLLRSAGLISVDVDKTNDSRVYGLRREIVPEAARMMGRYLAGSS